MVVICSHGDMLSNEHIETPSALAPSSHNFDMIETPWPRSCIPKSKSPMTSKYQRNILDHHDAECEFSIHIHLDLELVRLRGSRHTINLD